jgi:hypothetical protein
MADTNAFVHFDGRYQAFRIGQVIDDHDKNNTSRCMLCYAALMPVIPGPEDTTQVLVKAPVAAPVADLSLPQSKANRAARPRVKKSLRKIPKPANSWIIYRRDKHAAAKAANSAMKTADICKFLVLLVTIPLLIVNSESHFRYVEGREPRGSSSLRPACTG